MRTSTRPRKLDGGEAHDEGGHKILVTSPLAKDVTITQEYVCQIHSQRHIDVQALVSGYLEAIPVKEGQAGEEGGSCCSRLVPTLYKAKAGRREAAEARLRADWSRREHPDRLFHAKTQAVSQQ